MPVTQNSSAPYASSRVILNLLERNRARGLPNPITHDVLTRSGVTDSILTRTMQALQSLDLISEDGSHTGILEGLRLAPEAEYKNALADWLRSAYADALSFIDPATASETDIRDAFRAYKPVPQQHRMVSLFMGLFAAAGLMAEEKKRPSPRPRSPVTPAKEKRAAPVSVARSEPAVPRQPAQYVHATELPPALTGLLASLPPAGGTWLKSERDRFVQTFSAVLDFCFPVSTGKQLRSTQEDSE